MHCWYTSLGPVYRVLGSGGQYLYSIEWWTWSRLQSVGQQWHRPVNQSELQLPHCHQSPTLQHIYATTLQHICKQLHCNIVTYTATYMCVQNNIAALSPTLQRLAFTITCTGDSSRSTLKSTLSSDTALDYPASAVS